MLISTSLNFVFVANTKTASTSIEHVLTPHSDIVLDGAPARKHLPLAAIISERPDIFSPNAEGRDKFFKFGVMRDPLDWIGSWFRYRTGNEVESSLPADMDFESFWAQGDWNIRNRQTGKKYLQSDIFCDTNGEVLADMILPYDQLAPMFFEICSVWGLPFELPHKNVSRKASSSSVIPDHLREEVRAHYAEDYALMDRLEGLNAEGLARLRG